jgi:CheY-like chemotaxis protein
VGTRHRNADRRWWGTTLDKPVVLLVEDDALVLIAAEDALQGGGYAVLTSTGGRDALAALEMPPTNLAGIVTDIQLGSGPDGWEVARRAREVQADLPVVYVTAEAASEWPTKGVPNSLLVQKPFAPAQLLAAIATLITAADTNRTA